MGEFIIMLRNVLMFVALAIPGYILVKCGMVKSEQSGILSKILMYVGMPFMIISGTVNNLTLSAELMVQLLVVAAIGVAYTVVWFLVSKPLTSGEKNEKTAAMMRFCSIFGNNGFLGLPLAIAVFGRDSRVFTLLIVLNIINNLLLYTLGTYLVSGDRKSMSLKKALLNPVLIGFVVGIVMNLLNVKAYIPEAATFSDHFSSIVTPISMTVLGMKLATVKLSSLVTSKRNYYVSLVKLIFVPAIIVALLLVTSLFFEVSNDVILAFFIAFAVPTAGLSSTFADMYNGDTEHAVVFTLGSTLYSVLTIPILFWILNLFI